MALTGWTWLKVAPAGRNRSLVAYTSMCGCAINYAFDTLWLKIGHFTYTIEHMCLVPNWCTNYMVNSIWLESFNIAMFVIFGIAQMTLRLQYDDQGRNIT